MPKLGRYCPWRAFVHAGRGGNGQSANSRGTPSTASKLQMPLQLFGAKVIIIDGNLPGSLQQQLAGFCTRRLTFSTNILATAAAQLSAHGTSATPFSLA